MASIKPTILFIHGSWHSPKHFGPVRSIFEQHGYSTECPLLPTFNSKPAPPVVSLEDDVGAIQACLDRLIDEEGKEVIVIMHSYGGTVGSEAVHGAWNRQVRSEKGMPGGVIHLLFMCAFIVPVGSSLASTLGGSLPPFIPVQDNGLCTMDNPARRFYSDLSKEEQDHWVAELAPCPAIAQTTPLTYAAYLYHPATYLFCEGDQALPFEIQQTMVQQTGVYFATERCSAGHSPFLSQPETVLKIVNNIVG